ncbi:hypothetical protein [Caballeronia ptereochthonis]|uniref:Uncharacterized protein n=1 Tax=Caballeronia ptereochthonis TaxID=1777144 RepID=A0A158B6N4_9BURK|nr:hypothetical protein [Caballeronia ptereochthonis]SAK65406.1 hypothetical protein AWB83_02820 [Caballeronia ptereochthonis]
MNFLLLSQLPRVDESRRHYDAMLHLEARENRARAPARIWRRLTAIFR